MKKSFYKLKVDPEFEALIPPMKDPQYILLEKELKEFGCNKSIRTWDVYEAQNPVFDCTDVVSHTE